MGSINYIHFANKLDNNKLKEMISADIANKKNRERGNYNFF